ncbi:MAG: hypothetical protein MUE52_17945 [Tabrizicola sp.]|jgi:hypothetical protein|nr:hypothetical protein [Tabrizicola sp.]
MTSGRITVQRRGGPKFDLLRRYHILIDGVRVGSLWRGGRLTMDHAPGRAVIEARIDWCSATPLAVTVQPGAECVIEVVNPKGMAGAITGNDIFDPANYLVLHLISGPVLASGPWG